MDWRADAIPCPVRGASAVESMMTNDEQDYPRQAIGDQTGVAFPTTIEAMLEAGTPFLTQAFRATGAISPANAVTAIRETQEFFGGGMGRKMILEVEYALPDEGAPTRLFAKFPRDFGDPLRAWFTPPMEAETRFALLSRRSGFPVAVPRCMFGDYMAAIPTGLLITECIPFGTGTIEPAADKCLDDLLPDPLGHYEALTRAMARLAAAHKTGQLGGDVDERFPYHPRDVDTPLILCDADGLADKIARIRELALEKPAFFPAGVADPAFLDRFADDVQIVRRLESDIRLHLNLQRDYVAMCHWNMNVDNGWFWRDEAGDLQVGLLDWGSVGQMHLAQAFFGMTCGALPGFLNDHRDRLVSVLAQEYERLGGPAIDDAVLAEQIRLSISVLGVAWLLDAPEIIRREVPELADVHDPHDPRLRGNFLARAQLQLLVTLLNEWRETGIGDAIRRFETASVAQSAVA